MLSDHHSPLFFGVNRTVEYRRTFLPSSRRYQLATRWHDITHVSTDPATAPVQYTSPVIYTPKWFRII